MRVVIDPNVLISAVINPTGAPGRLIEAVRSGRLQLIACPILLNEFAGVLARPKFRRWLTEDEAIRFGIDLAALAEHNPDPEVPYPIATRDPNDDYLVALTLKAEADALISGDADLAQVGGFTLLTPRQALESINSEAGS